jgi:hypothetical protein
VLAAALAAAALVALAYQTRAAYVTALLTRKGDPFLSDFLGKSQAQILKNTLPHQVNVLCR